MPNTLLMKARTSTIPKPVRKRTSTALHVTVMSQSMNVLHDGEEGACTSHHGNPVNRRTSAAQCLCHWVSQQDIWESIGARRRRLQYVRKLHFCVSVRHFPSGTIQHFSERASLRMYKPCLPICCTNVSNL